MDSVLTSDGNIVTAELSMDANMTDNGVPFKCEAKNKAITTPLSETVTFQVFCKIYYDLTMLSYALIAYFIHSSCNRNDNSKPTEEIERRRERLLDVRVWIFQSPVESYILEKRARTSSAVGACNKEGGIRWQEDPNQTRTELDRIHGSVYLRMRSEEPSH